MSNRSDRLKERLNWYLALIVLFLFAVIPPALCGLFYLSQVPDVMWQRSEVSYDRIWLYRERRPVGIGYQSHRITESYSDTELCVENKLRFFLWGESSKAQPATTRQRMVLNDGQWQPTGEPCQ